MTPHEPDVTDMVAQLTRWHAHRETYTQHRGNETWINRHTTRVPPLLHQLEHAAPSGEGTDRGSGGYASRPAARIEALDTLIRIDLEAARWLRLEAHEDDPGSTIGCLKLLGSLMPSMHNCGKPCPRRDEAGLVTCCQAHELEVQITRWWRQARVTTGWDSPAWRPDNTCPMCEARGALRVQLVARTALCVECRETWGPEEYQVLGAHIRAEAGKERAPKDSAGPCWCPLPMPDVPDLRHQCPDCGSARCRHALGARLLDSIRPDSEAS